MMENYERESREIQYYSVSDFRRRQEVASFIENNLVVN